MSLISLSWISSQPKCHLLCGRLGWVISALHRLIATIVVAMHTNDSLVRLGGTKNLIRQHDKQDQVL